MNSPSLHYNNLPPDHILNKQRSNISIKQINKNIQTITNNTNTNNNTNTTSNNNITSPSIMNIPPNNNNNPITSILNNNNNSIMMLNNGQPIIMTTSNQQINVGGGGDLMLPPNNNNNIMNNNSSNLNVNNNLNSSLNSINNNNINNTTTENSNNNNNLILTNRTQFLLDSSSIINNVEMLFNIRIGNSKQIDMEITKSGNEIKHYSKSCIHDLDSLQRYWSECYRIESEHLNDKPLMYIPITGLINIKVFKLFNNIPIMEHNLEKKYDFRQSDSLIAPIKFDNNIVIVLKLMKMDYVEFIGLQSFDFYLIKSSQSSTSSSTITLQSSSTSSSSTGPIILNNQ
ncbi:predicted protein [Naegleria gruberi]|uniref:Predicted protein n=1 Tax=Naegleria gruberi TaxID=5762 RepID=D2VKA3_NAEGR|nr:uncharacterized protein NAEGRDRAFT_69323 [Naegleria gruberi]EFC42826.1 predicted protein [Naegleria gruberi]|eukprot:XP_002675570.1 predicted protein [Naegleria gruberi strain NEG-M]